MDEDAPIPRSGTDDLGLPSFATCSRCQAHMPVPGGRLGQRLRCPGCGGEARVTTSLQDEASAAIKPDRSGPPRTDLKLVSVGISTALLALVALLLWSAAPAAESPPPPTQATPTKPSLTLKTPSGETTATAQEEAMHAIEQIQMAWSLQAEASLDAHTVCKSDLDAMTMLEHVIATRRRSAILLAWRAEARRRRLDLPGAEDDLRSALLLRPDLPGLHTQLAMTLVDKAAMGLDARLIEVQASLAPDPLTLEEAADAFIMARAGERPDSSQIKDRLPLPLERYEDAATRIELAAALAFTQSEELRDSLQHLEAQSNDPAAGRVWRLIGLAHTYLGDRTAALAAYARAAGLRPHDPQIITDHALARHHANDGQGSLSDFDHALRLVPESATILVLRGLTSLARRALEGAQHDLDLAIARDPACPAAWATRASIHRFKKEPEKALEDLSRLLEFNPASQLGLMRRSELLLSLGKPKPALADALSYASLAPESAMAHYLQARAYKALKNIDAAMDAFNDAVALASPSSSLAGSPPQGRTPGQASERSARFLANLFGNRGALHFERGDLSEASQDLSRALEIQPGNSAYWTLRAEARLLAKDPVGAYTDYEQALLRNPDNAMARRGRAQMRWSRKDLRGALEDLNHALSVEPENPMFYQLRGMVRRDASDLAGALADHQRAVNLDPSNPRYLYSRGKSHLLVGKFDEAKADLQAALSRTSDGALATQIRSELSWLESQR